MALNKNVQFKNQSTTLNITVNFITGYMRDNLFQHYDESYIQRLLDQIQKGEGNVEYSNNVVRLHDFKKKELGGLWKLYDQNFPNNPNQSLPMFSRYINAYAMMQAKAFVYSYIDGGKKIVSHDELYLFAYMWQFGYFADYWLGEFHPDYPKIPNPDPKSIVVTGNVSYMNYAVRSTPKPVLKVMMDFINQNLNHTLMLNDPEPPSDKIPKEDWTHIRLLNNHYVYLAATSPSVMPDLFRLAQIINDMATGKVLFNDLNKYANEFNSLLDKLFTNQDNLSFSTYYPDLGRSVFILDDPRKEPPRLNFMMGKEVVNQILRGGIGFEGYISSVMHLTGAKWIFADKFLTHLDEAVIKELRHDPTAINQELKESSVHFDKLNAMATPIFLQSIKDSWPKLYDAFSSFASAYDKQNQVINQTILKNFRTAFKDAMRVATPEQISTYYNNDSLKYKNYIVAYPYFTLMKLHFENIQMKHEKELIIKTAGEIFGIMAVNKRKYKELFFSEFHKVADSSLPDKLKYDFVANPSASGFYPRIIKSFNSLKLLHWFAKTNGASKEALQPIYDVMELLIAVSVERNKSTISSTEFGLAYDDLKSLFDKLRSNSEIMFGWSNSTDMKAFLPLSFLSKENEVMEEIEKELLTIKSTFDFVKVNLGEATGKFYEELTVEQYIPPAVIEEIKQEVQKVEEIVKPKPQIIPTIDEAVNKVIEAVQQTEEKDEVQITDKPNQTLVEAQKPQPQPNERIQTAPVDDIVKQIEQQEELNIQEVLNANKKSKMVRNVAVASGLALLLFLN